MWDKDSIIVSDGRNPYYWNEERGWIRDHTQATRYTPEQVADTTVLPEGGYWTDADNPWGVRADLANRK